MRDSEPHRDNEGLTIQIYSSKGRQPTHFDNGSSWISSPEGRHLPVLASILMLDDGYAPYLYDKPTDNFFPDLMGEKDDNKVFNVLQKILEKGDKEYKQTPLCRAGQVVCFHPGEQPHAGVGHGDYKSLLTGKTTRMTLFGIFVPREVVSIIHNNPLFGTEGQTLGLMAEGWSPDRVNSHEHT